MAILGTADVSWTVEHSFNPSVTPIYNNTPVSITSAGVITQIGLNIRDWSYGATQAKVGLYYGTGDTKTKLGEALFVAADGLGKVLKNTDVSIPASLSQAIWGLLVTDGDLHLNGGPDTYSTQERAGTLSALPSSIQPTGTGADPANGLYAFFFTVEGTVGVTATGAGVTSNATAPTGTAAATGVYPGYTDILRNTDTGAVLANATGLEMSVTNTTTGAVIWSTTTGTTDASGRFTVKTGQPGSSGAVGSVGSVVQLKIKNPTGTLGSRLAAYEITLVDLGS